MNHLLFLPKRTTPRGDGASGGSKRGQRSFSAQPDKKSCASRLLIAGVLLLLAQPSTAVSQTVSSTEILTRKSTFIFRGTVEKLGASTMPAVKANDFTAVVRVDEVIDGPGAPPDLAGKQITVQLREAASVRPGVQAVFFTRGWLLGKSMAVIEVGRQAAAETRQTVRDQVKATRQKMADEDLQNELATSEAVVLGKVTGIRRSEIPHLGSEHDPDWYEARIAIESVIKGRLPAKEITLLFPHSEDVMWKNSPKFKEGEEGIFLLHRNQVRLPQVENQFTVLKALDFRPREELNRVQRLARSQQ